MVKIVNFLNKLIDSIGHSYYDALKAQGGLQAKCAPHPPRNPHDKK